MNHTFSSFSIRTCHTEWRHLCTSINWTSVFLFYLQVQNAWILRKQEQLQSQDFKMAKGYQFVRLYTRWSVLDKIHFLSEFSDSDSANSCVYSWRTSSSCPLICCTCNEVRIPIVIERRWSNSIFFVNRSTLGLKHKTDIKSIVQTKDTGMYAWICHLF